MGTDHLLYVKGNGFLIPFTEEYRRFRYRDVQTVALAKTSGLWVGVFLYAFAVLIFGSICAALLISRDPEDKGALVTTLAIPFPLAALSLVLLVRHWILGPRCICELRTGLVRERLRPVSRLHQGREILETLGERIREAQADLRAEETPAASAEGAAPPVRQIRVPRLSLLTFVVYGLAAAVLGAVIHFENLLVTLAMLTLGAIGAVPFLIALTQSVRHPAPDSIRNVLWTLMTLVLILAVGGLVYYFYVAIDNPDLTVDITGPVQALAGISHLGGPAFYWFFAALGAACLVTSGIGALLCFRWKSPAASAK